ncbi:MAG: tetratricopeptide repeat-containing sensor histidine kinase [Bacteroidales bacterium]|nr:tetratricopeptide repeat-containing sensor histidine kinase [Bacteroidales bacterium]MCF8457503.1 tetratricopeptide repeat-containing sensor histidine kinase [Bacteroidales bacterium]
MKGVFVILFTLLFLPLFSQENKKETVLSQISAAADDTGKVKLLLKHSYVVFESNIAESKTYAIKALDLSRQLENKGFEADALYQLALITEQQNDYEGAIEKLEEASSLFAEINDQSNVIKCLNKEGSIYVDNGKYETAIEKYVQSIRVAEKIGDRENISLCCYDMGIAYRKQNDLPKALECFYWALELPKKQGNQARVSKILNSIGLVYFHDKQYDKAIEVFNESLELKKTLRDQNGIAIVLNNLGLVYDQLKDYTRSIYYYQLSIKIKMELGQENKLDTSYLNIGLVYGKQDSIEKSLEYLKQSLAISATNGNTRNQAKCNGIIGSEYHKMGNSENAIPYLLKSIEIARVIDALDIQKFAYGLVARCYAEINDFESAYNYHIEFKDLNDSLFNEIKSIEIAEIQSKYELASNKEEIALQKAEIEKKRILNIALALIAWLFLVMALVFFRGRKKLKKANSILISKNKEIEDKQKVIEDTNFKLKEQKAELIGINKSKDKLFSIIGHDLRGPIGLLDSVLDTIYYKDFELEQKDIDKLLKSLHISAKSAMTLLENILFWANSQKGALLVNPSKCDLNEIVHETIHLHSHFSTQKNIAINVNIEPGIYVWFDPDMLRLIFRNLISNAIKFSYKGGKIEIWSKDGRSEVEVAILDHGVGIDIDQMRRIFKMNETVSTRGTANESGSGIGLSLCSEFVRKNNGRLWAESVVRKNNDLNTPGGSIFKLSLPAYLGQDAKE